MLAEGAQQAHEPLAPSGNEGVGVGMDGDGPGG
jgi:hypothetical protein